MDDMSGAKFAPSPTVLEFKEQMSGEITAAMRRMHAAITHIDAIVLRDLCVEDMVRVFEYSRTLYEAMDETRKRLHKSIERLSQDTIPTMFMNLGKSSETLVDIGRVTVSYRCSVSMPDREKGFEWLRKTGNEALIQETVNAQTLGAFVNNTYLKSNLEPPEVFKVSMSPFTSITKR